MSDTADKTIIRSSRKTPTADETVIRPSPGRRASQNPRQSPGQAIPSDNFDLPVMQAQERAAPQQINPDVIVQHIGPNVNDLISCAATLIGVYSQLKNTMAHNDESGLYSRLINEIKLFEKHSKELMIKPETVLASRYILCTMLDEAIMNTPWGSTGQWSQHTLLSTFHNETAGGEKFFLILDRMRETPAENIEIIELMYLCLSIGFEGKYRVIYNGKEQIELIRDDLFSLIRNFRGEFERDLSFGWTGQLGKTSTLTEYLPVWVVASVFSMIMFFSYLGFHLWLSESSSNVMDRIDKITTIMDESKQVKKTSSFKKNTERDADNIFIRRGSH